VCGDDSAVPLLRELALSVGNEFEVRRYKRLTPLTVLSKGLGKLLLFQILSTEFF
jgi:ATP-dependent RNA helicase SUPV3L1/SUV3